MGVEQQTRPNGITLSTLSDVLAAGQQLGGKSDGARAGAMLFVSLLDGVCRIPSM